MRKIQLVIPSFDTQYLGPILRRNPETVIVTDREHNPYYAETKYERYIAPEHWHVSPQVLETFIRDNGPDLSYSTPSAFAKSLWTRYFWPHDYILRTDGFRFRMCREALYGGRCEVYQYGPGHYYQYDINSSYPYASTQLTFPEVSSLRYVKDPLLRNIDTYDGVSRVVFSQGGSIPPLPVRANARVIYPICDHMTGTYTHTELRYAMSVGVEVHTVLKQYVADRMLDDNPFTDYVNYCYARRGDSKVWKRVMNVLYGRLAVSQNDLYRFHIARDRGELLAAPRYLKDYFGANCVADVFSPPPEGNALWAAMVLAQARIRLHYYASYAVYMDTDCIFSRSTISVPVSPELGDWKVLDADFDIRGAKAYRVQSPSGDSILKLKGIPTATRTLDDFLKAKATQERTKLADGSTIPIRLEGNSNGN